MHDVDEALQAAQLAEPDSAAARLPGQKQRLRLDAKAGSQEVEHMAGFGECQGHSVRGHCNALQELHSGVRERLCID